MLTQANTIVEHSPNTEVSSGLLNVPNFGTLFLRWSKKGLREMRFNNSENESSASTIVTVPDYYARPLTDYFNGEPIDPALLAVDLEGTPFQVRVWQALGAIRRGGVRSYAGIARDLGSPRAMRAVGRAVGANPILVAVPCHRVVREDLGLGGFSAGLELKRKLLSLEGIAVQDEHVFPGQLSLQESYN
ncbi:MAG: methylated-DNA--[protein]-cysteine S-methyltransferase [Myxococcales bacterium]|nr:MAG: methylated-DNA--[protein]-cysteine S-methyltransferase [Myxococcales bacterium]